MKILLATFSLVTLTLLAAPTGRAQFVPGPNPIAGTVTAAQTLPGGAGLVSSTGNLQVSGSTVDGGAELQERADHNCLWMFLEIRCDNLTRFGRPGKMRSPGETNDLIQGGIKEQCVDYRGRYPDAARDVLVKKFCLFP